MYITIKSIAACAVFTLASSLFGTYSWAALPIQKFQLPGGAAVFLVESPAIAMLDVQIDFDGGSRRDPASKAGLASMSANLLEKGVLGKGTQVALDENALGEAWADLGAQFNASAGSDRLSFSLRTLTARPAGQSRGIGCTANRRANIPGRRLATRSAKSYRRIERSRHAAQHIGPACLRPGGVRRTSVRL